MTYKHKKVVIKKFGVWGLGLLQSGTIGGSMRGTDTIVEKFTL